MLTTSPDLAAQRPTRTWLRISPRDTPSSRSWRWLSRPACASAELLPESVPHRRSLRRRGWSPLGSSTARGRVRSPAVTTTASALDLRAARPTTPETAVTGLTCSVRCAPAAPVPTVAPPGGTSAHRHPPRVPARRDPGRGDGEDGRAAAELGYDVVVEPAPARRPTSRTRRSPRPGSAVGTADDVWSSDIVVKVNAPTPRRDRPAAPGATVIALMAPARSPELVEALAAARRHRAGDGRGAADLPRAVDGRAVARWPTSPATAPSSRRPTSSAGSSPARSPRPARSRRRGCSWSAPASPGSRRSAPPGQHGRERARVRRTPRGRRADRVDGRAVRHASTWSRRSPDGYAKEMTAEQEAATAAMYDEEARDADIVITTALVPGRPAPQRSPPRWSPAMRPGTVIVDMAAANGGNVELTRDRRARRHRQRRDDHRLHRPGRPAGRADRAALRHQHRQPAQAADPRQGRRAGARPGRRRRSAASRSTRDGEVAVAAAARAGLGRAGRAGCCRSSRRRPPKPPPDPRRKLYVGRRSPPCSSSLARDATRRRSFLGHFTVFVLAVVRRLLRDLQRRARAAHAADGRDQRDLRDHPGRRHPAGRQSTTSRSRCWRSSPCCVATINIFGGFLVTLRMLEMFRKD